MKLVRNVLRCLSMRMPKLKIQKFRDELFIAWNALDALGRIYVANEGINAQMSVPADHFEEFRNTLEAYDFMKGIRLNVAVEQDNYSFKIDHKSET